MELNHLISRAWVLHEEAEREGIGVRNSIPILYFGDLTAYCRSPLRIVTAALNPSGSEFPFTAGTELVRFPYASQLAQRSYDGSPEAHEVYIQSLNEYYRRAPYRRWFDGAYRAILKGLSASFYGEAPNVALHTDIASPVATDPTWSRLPDSTCRRIVGAGTDLWHDLIETLEPDVVLISVGEAHLHRLKFDQLTVWQEVARVERTNPYIVRTARGRLRSGKEALFVFGRAAQMPFGLISDRDRERIGREIATAFQSS